MNSPTTTAWRRKVSGIGMASCAAVANRRWHCILRNSAERAYSKEVRTLRMPAIDAQSISGCCSLCSSSIRYVDSQRT